MSLILGLIGLWVSAFLFRALYRRLANSTTTRGASHFRLAAKR